MTPTQEALWIVLGVALAVSVITDLATHKILDVVTWPTIGLGLGVRFFGEGVGGAESGLVSGVLGLLLTAAPFLIAAWRGKMGWGDVKLMAAVGAVTGWPLAMYALSCVALAGALQAVVTLIWKGEVWETMSTVLRRWGQKVRLVSKDEKVPELSRIPYGVAIAVGTIWALWWQYPADKLAR